VQTPSALVTLLEPWAEAYGNSSALPTLIVFGHLAGLLLAGGTAVVLDRATLRAVHGPTDERQRQLDALQAGHRWVIRGLALSALTGVLLLTADIETYVVSAIFWTKMGLVGLLLVNGYVMTRVERGVRTAPDAARWNALRTHALTSLVLWFAVLLAGVALVNS
jgi:uncharacterized membrane protein